jgi:hypothetical protein
MQLDFSNSIKKVIDIRYGHQNIELTSAIGIVNGWRRPGNVGALLGTFASAPSFVGKFA